MATLAATKTVAEAKAVTETKPIAETKTVVGEERFLLRGISWGVYKALCDEVDGRTYRLSYIDGDLEIMNTKSPHEFHKTLLAKLLEQIMYEYNIPVRSGGNMTFQRDDLEKGFEPDECWWLAHEAEVRGKKEFDFTKDPPPDLAVEIEMTRSLVSRVGIYAAMGVPEIWRFNGRKLRFCLLQPDGTYQDAAASAAFPFLKSEQVEPFLKIDPDVDETTRLRQFMDWLRTQDVQI